MGNIYKNNHSLLLNITRIILELAITRTGVWSVSSKYNTLVAVVLFF